MVRLPNIVVGFSSHKLWEIQLFVRKLIVTLNDLHNKIKHVFISHKYNMDQNLNDKYDLNLSSKMTN